ncbi:MAG: hypothetical protein A2086_12700 [Spirochaetes bacterium GWD1_27_9]|nr:MAG: hypothetical protein A2Z98_11890 [Spirochaetes bacterium GWB1_27_13]OHD25789.1 MAG: hypothetical protein A2Y34_03615 [Spirochaetes bacterium GWC1_27_15]OHD42377.1 MAG: hypothetical protein A2086_12700 [Spirochaetes bacterium GWD1_27_9]
MEIKNCIIKYSKNNQKFEYLFEITESNISNDDFEAIISTNKLEKGFILSMEINPKTQISLIDLYLELPYNFKKEDKILINGYQSWSSTEEVKVNDKLIGFPFFSKSKIVDRYKLNNFGDYNFHKYSGKKGELHSWNHTYIKDIDYNLDFIGSLSEDTGFTYFEFKTQKNVIYIKKDLSGLTTDKKFNAFNLFFMTGKENEVFDNYFSNMKIEKPKSQMATGFTSWYNYFTNITEEIILQNLENFKSKNIPIDIFQIDDGYQMAVGDWLNTNKKFPNGMKKIAEKINSYGYKSGLWLAPFICEHKSEIFTKHNDWVLKDQNGKYVFAGNNDGWSGPFYALDFYNEGFRNYLKDVFKKVFSEWGFDMVKLDFLYAVALIPQKGKSRGQVMAETIDFLKEITKDKLILGCGVPLSSAYGKIEYCRIGCDVHPHCWEDERLKKIGYRERISTLSTLKDTIYRRQLNGNTFHNDPDVFVLREENVALDPEQKHTLFLLNLIFGGLVFTSDDISKYDEDTLNLYLSQFPQKPKVIKEVKNEGNVYKFEFSIDGKEYLAYSNLGEYLVSFNIPEEADFFTDGDIIAANTRLSLQGFESICFYKIGKSDFELLGSTGHIFPTSEIEEFKVENDNIIIKLNPKFVNTNEIFIKIPENYDGFKINGTFIKAEKVGELNVIIYEV